MGVGSGDGADCGGRSSGSNYLLDMMYYMNFVTGEPIARVFTNDYRNRSGFSNQDASSLIDNMRNIITFAHNRNALLIDANLVRRVTVLL